MRISLSTGDWWGDFLDLDEIAQILLCLLFYFNPHWPPSHLFVGPVGKLISGILPFHCPFSCLGCFRKNLTGCSDGESWRCTAYPTSFKPHLQPPSPPKNRGHVCSLTCVSPSEPALAAMRNGSLRDSHRTLGPKMDTLFLSWWRESGLPSSFYLESPHFY